MALLAANLHLKPQVQDTRFASLILGVNTSKIDVIASTMYVTPERAQQVNFIPYMKTGGSLLVDKSDAFRPRVPEDLCGKSVSSIKGAAWIARFAKVSETVCKSKGLGPILVREFPSSPEATQALLSHAVNAQFEDAAVAKAAAGKSAGRLLISSHSMIYPVVVGLALPKSNPGLQTALNNAFEAIKKNGKYAVLLKKYNVQLPTGADIKNALASDH
jgi:polar amino acid transport system substrate-binding protein